ncbi:MAG: Major facilitator superfamily MFS1 [Microgenomates group bacterium Gr01-1014_16]|nr:MAG: Major facilitator superfamily MFS1 [Microgenomates group bacterium Gr01-1014_16]
MQNQTFKSLLKNPNFVRLWTSQLLSQLTVNLVNFLMLTRIFAATGSTIAVALIWISWSLPALIFGPFSGALVDSFSRRLMMIVTNLLQSAVIASYFLIKDHFFALYLIVFAYSLFDQLYIPSQQASLPALVDKKLLSAANGIFLLTQQGSFLLGMGLGGILLSLLGVDFTIILSSLALFIAAVSVYFLPHDSPLVSAWDKSLGQFWHEFHQGLNFVKNHRSVLLPLILLVGLQIFISIIAISLPSYTKNSLGLDLKHAGITLLVPGALGALLFTRSLPKQLLQQRKKPIVQNGFLLGSISLISLALLPFLPRGKLIISVLISMGLGVSLTAIMVPTQTLLQEKTPPWFRGRIYSSLGFLMTVATSLPLILAAALTDILGTSAIMIIMSLILFATYLFINKRGDHVLANGFGL